MGVTLGGAVAVTVVEGCGSGVGVRDGEAFGLAVRVGVTVAEPAGEVAVDVTVTEAETVAPGVPVIVGSAVTVAVGSSLTVALPDAVAVGVAECTGVDVTESLGVELGVMAAVGVTLATVGVGVGGQPTSAADTAAISSSMVIAPLPLMSPAGQRSVPVPSRAMSTRVTSSSMVTVPLPSQSPGHAARPGPGTRMAAAATAAQHMAGTIERLKRGSRTLSGYRVRNR